MYQITVPNEEFSYRMDHVQLVVDTNHSKEPVSSLSATLSLSVLLSSYTTEELTSDWSIFRVTGQQHPGVSGREELTCVEGVQSHRTLLVLLERFVLFITGKNDFIH